MKMARKTKKMKTDIQLLVLNEKGRGDSLSPASTNASPDLDTLLASVFRVFAARGRAIRAKRAKMEAQRESTNQ
jgi:hypothetical protein